MQQGRTVKRGAKQVWRTAQGRAQGAARWYRKPLGPMTIFAKARILYGPIGEIEPALDSWFKISLSLGQK